MSSRPMIPGLHSLLSFNSIHYSHWMSLMTWWTRFAPSLWFLSLFGAKATDLLFGPLLSLREEVSSRTLPYTIGTYVSYTKADISTWLSYRLCRILTLRISRFFVQAGVHCPGPQLPPFPPPPALLLHLRNEVASLLLESAAGEVWIVEPGVQPHL